MISVLVKPASGLCSIACRYCFYRDEVEAREVGQRGIMSETTSDTMIREIFAAARRSVVIAFQGGEPTLAGEDYFDNIAALVGKYNVRKLPVSYAIQTNGVDISDRLIEIFCRDRYLVGVSIDGDAKMHDANRVDRAGNGTHARVTENAQRMMKAGVDVNALSVLTNDNAKRIGAAYKYFTSHNFKWIQFINSLPALDGCKSGDWLTPDRWLSANRTLFDLWYADVSSGREISVRHFENYLMLYLGMRAESCDMRGECTVQFVIEADGSVYPCDFYALDEYRLGSIGDGLEALRSSDAAREFVSRRQLRDKCRECKWARLCMGGCRRYSSGEGYLYCSVLPEFFEYANERFIRLARKISSAGQ